jgi:hypothetical protein
VGDIDRMTPGEFHADSLTGFLLVEKVDDFILIRA